MDILVPAMSKQNASIPLILSLHATTTVQPTTKLGRKTCRLEHLVMLAR
jgi:hypothetical protein